MRKNEKFKPPVLSNGDTHDEPLKRSRYALMQTPDKWSERQKVRMKLQSELYPKIKKVYDTVNRLRAIFRSSSLTKETAKPRFRECYARKDLLCILVFSSIPFVILFKKVYTRVSPFFLLLNPIASIRQEFFWLVLIFINAYCYRFLIASRVFSATTTLTVPDRFFFAFDKHKKIALRTPNRDVQNYKLLSIRQF